MAKVMDVWPPPAYNGKVRFEIWEVQLELYMTAKKVADDQKAYCLLQHIGLDMLEKIYDWVSPAKPKDKTYDELITVITNHCSSPSNLFALRVKLFNEKQQPGQSIQDYISHMSQLYGQCGMNKMTPQEYGVLAILRGIESDELRQFLMNPSNTLTDIEATRKLAVSFEQSRIGSKAIKDHGLTNSYNMNVVGNRFKCKYCGEDHRPGKEMCPANGKKCKSCGKQNHFVKVCKSSRKQYQVEEDSDAETPNARERFADGYSNMNGIYDVLTVSSRHEEDSPPFKVTAKLDGTSVMFQHDSGAAVSLIIARCCKSRRLACCK